MFILVFCYASRGESGTCSAKEGNPFGPYWDKFSIDFDKDVFYGPLGFDLSFEDHKLGWLQNYPAEKYPVLAFTGAPGAFPVLERHVGLQKYLQWSTDLEKEADAFLARYITNEGDKLIGIHLRNGIDFVNKDSIR
jgi:peptide-O-fucosyltransferase